MAWPSTPRIRLTRRQRRELARLAARTSAAHALVQRARMILRLASGQWPATVARALGMSDRCVRKWRGRGVVPRGGRGPGGAGPPRGPPPGLGAGEGGVGGGGRGWGKGGGVPGGVG